MPQTGSSGLAFLEKAREAVSELSVAEDSERQMEPTVSGWNGRLRQNKSRWRMLFRQR